MKKIIPLIIMSFISSAAIAQQQPTQTYAPIVLDEAKFDKFYSALSDIPMTQKTWQQIFALLQALERDALQERAKSSPPIVETPKND